MIPNHRRAGTRALTSSSSDNTRTWSFSGVNSSTYLFSSKDRVSDHLPWMWKHYDVPLWRMSSKQSRKINPLEIKDEKKLETMKKKQISKENRIKWRRILMMFLYQCFANKFKLQIHVSIYSKKRTQLFSKLNFCLRLK